MTYSIKKLHWRDIRLIGLLILFIFFVFLPCLKAGFINWDDDRYVTENPQIQGFSLSQFSKPFLFPRTANYYQPLTFLSYSLEYKYFGLNPFVYHLDNVLLHLMNVVLVFLLSYYLSFGSKKVSFLTAIFFGLHPLRVESVAWIAERNDVLFSFFFLSGLLCYILLISSKSQEKHFFWLAILCCISAVLSKPQAISFPLLLCAIDFYYGRGLSWKVIQEKIPFFLIAILSLIINMTFLKPALEITSYNSYSGIDKIILANFALLSVLFKTFLPIHLSLIYPFPSLHQLGLESAIAWMSPILVIVLLVGGLYYFKKSKIFIFSCLFFFITIFLPVINMNYGFFLNDRYTYLPQVGLFWGISMAIAALLSHIRQSHYKNIIGILLAIGVVSLSIATHQRAMIWQDNILVWSDVIKNFPTVALAYSKRAILESDAGLHAQALDDFNKAIELKPQEFSLYNNRGYAFLRATQYNRAIADFTTAISLKPDYIEAYRNRGESFYFLGFYKQAINDINIANQLVTRNAH